MSHEPLATMFTDGEHGGVRLDLTCDVSPDELWLWCTDPGRLAAWAGSVDGDLREGGEMRLAFTTGWEGTGRIARCEAPHALTLETSGEGATSTISVNVVPDGDAAVLRVEETGLPVQGLINYVGGWYLHLQDLATALDGGTPSPMQDRWSALQPELEKLVIDER